LWGIDIAYIIVREVKQNVVNVKLNYFQNVNIVVINIVMGNIVEYQNHIIVRNAGKNIAENTNVQLVETIIAMIVKILRNVGREIVKNMIAKVVD
jgi:hypothetical protein